MKWKPERTISIPLPEVAILWQLSPFACLCLKLTESLLAVVHDLRNLAVQFFASQTLKDVSGTVLWTNYHQGKAATETQTIQCTVTALLLTAALCEPDAQKCFWNWLWTHYHQGKTAEERNESM